MSTWSKRRPPQATVRSNAKCPLLACVANSQFHRKNSLDKTREKQPWYVEYASPAGKLRRRARHLVSDRTVTGLNLPFTDIRRSVSARNRRRPSIHRAYDHELADDRVVAPCPMSRI